MYIDRMLAPIETLGPGSRLVIWTKGCSKHCNACANPELWDVSGSKYYSVNDLINIVKNIKKKVNFDGVTISGGDPLEQKEEMLEFVEKLSVIEEDILVYTGYRYDYLKSIWTHEEMNKLKTSIAVLVDGEYIDELNTDDTVLRGSSNQNIIYFNNNVKEIYKKYLSEGRKIQNVYFDEKLVSVGIHNRRSEYVQ